MLRILCLGSATFEGGGEKNIKMYKRLKKHISIFLIIALLLGRVSFVVPVIHANDLSPTSSPAPTSAPAPSSDPAPTRPPRDPQPTRDAVPTSSPVPTSAPQPTSSPGQNIPSLTDSSASTAEESQTDSSQQRGGSDEQSTDSAEKDTSSNKDYSSSGDSSVNDPANVSTGPFSQNSASETLEQKMEILNKNLAELDNKIEAISSTGFNHADLNTLGGQVFTSDSVSTLNLLNKLNSNIEGVGGFSVFNIYDTYIGDIAFQLANPSMAESFEEASETVSKNSLTGPDSLNKANASNTFTVKETNGNDAEIVNDIVLQSSTGSNSASFNTGDGSIKTGDALALGNIINLANTNLNVSQWLFGVVNIWGALLGDIILPQDKGDDGGVHPSETVLVENNNTGPMSSNNVSYESTDIAEFENVNSAEVTSNLDVSANTGNNSASVNTGGGSVTTGIADAVVSNSTVANSNTISEEGTVWMVIVNQAGRWIGHILGSPWGTTTASNNLPVTTESAGVGSHSFSTTVQNTATGPLSSNEASFSHTENTSQSSENSASIVNNIKASADSGNNEAFYNTGAGQIETGNAEVGLNLLSMANTNVMAKKFIAILVNILGTGTFLGNIIPPDQQVKKIASIPSPTDSLDDPANSSANTPTPTPTIYQPSNYGANTGGPQTPSWVTPTPIPDSHLQILADDSYFNYYYDEEQFYPEEYYQAVAQVQDAKKRVVLSKKQFSQGVPTKQYIDNQAHKLTRGIFLSPAFAKATETSFAGILLGGASSLKINQSWLFVVPLAVLIVFLRRRKVDFTKYINAILEVLL